MNRSIPLAGSDHCGLHLFFCIVLGLLLAVSSATAATPAGPTVDITKFAFTPGELTIAPGTTVGWTNHDEVPHTVASTDKRLMSKALDTDDRFEHTFNEEGDFAYYCTLHPFMTGVVHVRKP
ncbi:MAG TPA: cupredoxin family copper-binding protein [Dokdonella sp.]